MTPLDETLALINFCKARHFGRGFVPTLPRPIPLRRVDGRPNGNAFTAMLRFEPFLTAGIRWGSAEEMIAEQRRASIQFNAKLQEEDRIIDEFCGLIPPEPVDPRSWQPQYQDLPMVIDPYTLKKRPLINVYPTAFNVRALFG